jgi:rod shape-determining protein MreD
MIAAFSWRILKWFGGRLPFLLAIIASIAGVIPLLLPGGLEVTPLFPLMVIFFWGLHRGDLMTPAPIFLTGLFYDLLSGAPPGLWALTFLICHAVALTLRDMFGRVLYSSWMIFAITCCTAETVAWFLVSLYNWSIFHPLPFVVQALVTIGLYPFFGFAFAFIERRVVMPMRA